MSGTDREILDFIPPPAPGIPVIEDNGVRLIRLDPERHAAPLFLAIQDADALWDYLAYGPFANAGAYRDWQLQMAKLSDPCFYAIVPQQSGQAAGLASFLRIDQTHGSIEIGHVMLSPGLQRSRAASAALMAMITWAFDAGYRRVEWKCNAQNAASRRAALRLGFRFEGLFRQHMIVKGVNRDTAWFSILNSEWLRLRSAYQEWLAPENFDARGEQRQSLSELTKCALPGRDDLGLFSATSEPRAEPV